MSGNGSPFPDLAGRGLFIVWGPGPRSGVFARQLGIEVHYVSATKRRGLLAAPAKYSSRAIRTAALLRRRRPSIVFVQSPPNLAVMAVYLYCRLTGARYVVDAHSDAFQSVYWTHPEWLNRILARAAVATVVTNERFAQTLRGWGATAFVLRDIPTTFPKTASYALDGGFNVAVVNTFSPDEPLDEILAAAATLDDVVFHVTGDPRRGRRPMPPPSEVPANVRFTGFLPDDAYYGLLGSSQAVMCLTTRDDTMQRGACEALALATPIITSRWPLLESYFDRGTVHVSNTVEGVRAGVEEMVRGHVRYESEVKELREERRQEWERTAADLAELLQAALPPAALQPRDDAQHVVTSS